jgi:hypothetical protein
LLVPAVGALAALVLLGRAAPALADPGPMITSPTDGQTVQLDSRWNLNVGWTLPAGQRTDDVYAGDEPIDPASSQPPDAHGYQPICTGTTSCEASGDKVWAAGTHYMYVMSDDSETQLYYRYYYSPLVRYIVAPKLAWGCGPDPSVQSSGCAVGVRALHSYDVARRAHMGLEVAAGYNTPAAFPVTVRVTFKHGRRVVKRLSVTRHPASGESVHGLGFDNYELTFDWSSLHLRGVRPGARLSITVVVSVAGQTLTRTVALRAT